MTLDELIELQAEKELGDVHLLDTDEKGFRLAHTDAEREGDVPLEECSIHQWLSAFDEMPIAPGQYTIAVNDDGHFVISPFSSAIL